MRLRFRKPFINRSYVAPAFRWLDRRALRRVTAMLGIRAWHQAHPYAKLRHYRSDADNLAYSGYAEYGAFVRLCPLA
jgi:hypothetical protein